MPTRASVRRFRVGLSAAALAAAALGALLPPAQAAGAPPGAHPDERLQRQLDRLVAQDDGPPGVIAVLTRGDRTRVYTAGVGDIATGRPPHLDDHMRIASIAKAFSGAVALRLVDQGALSLDDTIGDVLPEQPEAWHAVTLRQLLQHTSGLPDFSAAPAFLRILQADPRHVFDSRTLLDFVAREPLLFVPGSLYEYSNSDNIAVALMAEAATGRRYEDLLKDLVYRPLGLRRTSLPQGYRLPRPFLHGYDVSPPAAPEDVSEAVGASGVWASGGIVSTPRELGAFIRAYGGPGLLSRKTRAEQLAFRPGDASEPAGPGTNAAGLALFQYTTRCGVLYGHTGNFPGYTQLAAATPDGTRSLTFSINTQTSKGNKPALLARLRTVQEDFACALLKDR
ncbi:class A beta-lactamase-related serine hydrolase [Streptomyces sp. WAC07149]|uniref:serine hydrolase domain-containing protein n=1 Tax=Streptomyces sp. WAC07149 TaxID=2487425 RepID=UPI000F788D72|nr:serine hydrolase domain-containing protein [Streptomyces sp. WAC07149]RST04790.1 class A beta-lactamase-related serine hydrolase [Streptomyces sp. WAC07149]